MPLLPARPPPGPLPQRPPPGRLAQSLAGRRPRGVPRRLGQPGLQLRDPLPGPPQLRPRLGKLLPQRYDKRGEHLGGRRALLSGHTRTLRLKIAHRTGLGHAGAPARPTRLRQASSQDVGEDLKLAVTFGPDQPQRFLTAWLGPPSRDAPNPAASDLPTALAEWHRQASRWDAPVMRQNRVPARREMDGAAREAVAVARPQPDPVDLGWPARLDDGQ